MTQQPDLFVEADERRKPKSADAAAYIRRLPVGLSLSVADVANAFEMSNETVRGYIDSGDLRIFPGHGTQRRTGRITYISACDLANKIFPS